MTETPQRNTGLKCEQPFDFFGHIDTVAHLLRPPVGNHLIFGHKEQLKIMFVGGPNQRPDYHLNGGEELFYQIKGVLDLKIIEHGKPRTVRVEEGEMFCLPPGIPHSPQRYVNTVGLVIERERGDESDGLLWFIDDTKDENVSILVEKYFHCYDLGSQLKPLIEEYLQSEECTSRVPKPGVPTANPAISMDSAMTVPPPFLLRDALSNVVNHTVNTAVPLELGLYDRQSTEEGKGEFVVQVFTGSAVGGKAMSPLPKEIFVWALGPISSFDSNACGAEEANDKNAIAPGAPSIVTCGDQRWEVQSGQAVYVSPSAAKNEYNGSEFTIQQAETSVVLCIFNRVYYASPAALM